MERERQTTEFAEHVSAGRMSYSQGERTCTFLDLERLGLVTSYYPKSVLAARRREARLLGWHQTTPACLTSMLSSSTC